MYCDDVIYSDHLSFYQSFIQDSIHANQDPLSILWLPDLRFYNYNIQSDCSYFCKVNDASRCACCCLSNIVIGIKGLLNLGGTDAFNCVLQCFLHLPFLIDFFLSGNHSSIVCHLSLVNRSPVSCILPWMSRTSVTVFSAASASFSSASSVMTIAPSASPLTSSTAFGWND